MLNVALKIPKLVQVFETKLPMFVRQETPWLPDAILVLKRCVGFTRPFPHDAPIQIVPRGFVIAPAVLGFRPTSVVELMCDLVSHRLNNGILDTLRSLPGWDSADSVTVGKSRHMPVPARHVSA